MSRARVRFGKEVSVKGDPTTTFTMRWATSERRLLEEAAARRGTNIASLVRDTVLADIARHRAEDVESPVVQ